MSAVVDGQVCGHSVEYRISGTQEEVTAAISELYGRFPTPGYGTCFNWPPGGPNQKFNVPRELGNGRWEARGHRSTSCD